MQDHSRNVTAGKECGIHASRRNCHQCTRPRGERGGVDHNDNRALLRFLRGGANNPHDGREVVARVALAEPRSRTTPANGREHGVAIGANQDEVRCHKGQHHPQGNRRGIIPQIQPGQRVVQWLRRPTTCGSFTDDERGVVDDAHVGRLGQPAGGEVA